ncbi:MAG: restriction endonuclease subunit S [Bacteroidaceae bacterium]|nr:restriction endonuclease subunit S [Bacteroidaceae bacterium]
MKKYERYKDSGVQWLGSVPEHWEVMPMKRLFSFCKGLTITKADLTEVGHPVISYGQIHSKQNTGVHTDDCLLRFVPDKITKDNDNCKVYPGDFIFADTSEDLDGCGNCAYIDREGIYAGYHSLVARPFDNTISKYWAYLFQSALWRSQIRSNVYGIKVFSITQTILKEVAVLVPSVDNAAKIVSYLDSQVSKINAVITEKEKMISDMEKYRFSLISETVTKGLNPDAPMKDSGVDWIGEIPEHWSTLPLRRISKIILGKMLSLSKTSDAIHLKKYICAKDVHFSGIDTSDLKEMYFTEKEQNSYQVEIGDMLIVEGGAGAGGCAIIEEPTPETMIQNSIMIVRGNKKMENKYICYFVRSIVEKGYIEMVSNVATIPHFTKDKLGNTTISVPPIDEQEQIASFLDSQTSKIDSLISELKSQIEDLKSYKQSLITEAVTGQVDVRDWTPNE